MKKTGGRNNYGRMTTRHIGGGHKRLYREIDFKRNKDDVSAAVERIEYDPNRNAFIASSYDFMLKSYQYIFVVVQLSLQKLNQPLFVFL